jgi:hypothetical protein
MTSKSRHSGADRNPARNTLREADKNEMLSRFAENYLTVWIPACAGMTQFVILEGI